MLSLTLTVRVYTQTFPDTHCLTSCKVVFSLSNEWWHRCGLVSVFLSLAKQNLSVLLSTNIFSIRVLFSMCHVTVQSGYFVSFSWPEHFLCQAQLFSFNFYFTITIFFWFLFQQNYFIFECFLQTLHMPSFTKYWYHL